MHTYLQFVVDHYWNHLIINNFIPLFVILFYFCVYFCFNIIVHLFQVRGKCKWSVYSSSPVPEVSTASRCLSCSPAAVLDVSPASRCLSVYTHLQLFLRWVLHLAAYQYSPSPVPEVRTASRYSSVLIFNGFCLWVPHHIAVCCVGPDLSYLPVFVKCEIRYHLGCKFFLPVH